MDELVKKIDITQGLEKDYIGGYGDEMIYAVREVVTKEQLQKVFATWTQKGSIESLIKSIQADGEGLQDFLSFSNRLWNSS